VEYILLILAAYLAGSIPFGVIVARAHGVDLRKVGSGNIGATNVGRALGRKWGIVCFALDMLKGLVPMLVAMAMLPPEKGPRELWIWLATGGATIVGHVFPVYLKFRGGKGVATSLGVVIGLWPYYTVCGAVALASWLLAVWMWRYVSLGSIIASLDFLAALIIAIAIVPSWHFADLWPLVAFAGAMACLVIVRHKDNIGRLMAGTESKIGQKKQQQ
jgi:acyl phosphate:glycerol-3-phosphate acyltransferase